jgi:hypothetical protein
MTGVQEALGRPGSSRAGATDGRAWLRLGLAVAGLAALAISGLIGAQSDRGGGLRSASPEISQAEGYARWTGPTPGWRSRSQILKDAGVLKHR